MRENEKGIAVILPILLVLLIIGVVGYFAYQSIQLGKLQTEKTPPLSSTTKEITKYVDFEVEGPGGWYEIDNLYEKTFSNFDMETTSVMETTEKNPVFFKVVHMDTAPYSYQLDKGKVSAEEYYSYLADLSKNESFTGQGTVKTKLEEFNLGSYPAIRVLLTPDEEVGVTHTHGERIYVSTDKGTFWIYMSAQSYDSYAANKDLFDVFAESFSLK